MSETEPTMRQLKSRSQLLKPAIRLGKAGASPEFLAEFRQLLATNHLVKIRFEGFQDARKTLSKELAGTTGSVLVQQVGHTAVYYLQPSAG
ncbi:MAG: YhbY family RNA-binding protein [Verrucomicrobiae bacterium]